MPTRPITQEKEETLSDYVDNDGLRERTGLVPENGPEFEPGTGHREGDGQVTLYDPSDPRRP